MYLLSPELLHQPLLLPQYLVLLAELPQQLLCQGGKRKKGEDEEDENPTGMKPGLMGLMGLMALGWGFQPPAVIAGTWG